MTVNDGSLLVSHLYNRNMKESAKDVQLTHAQNLWQRATATRVNNDTNLQRRRCHVFLDEKILVSPIYFLERVQSNQKQRTDEMCCDQTGHLKHITTAVLQANFKNIIMPRPAYGLLLILWNMLSLSLLCHRNSRHAYGALPMTALIGLVTLTFSPLNRFTGYRCDGLVPVQ